MTMMKVERSAAATDLTTTLTASTADSSSSNFTAQATGQQSHRCVNNCTILSWDFYWHLNLSACFACLCYNLSFNSNVYNGYSTAICNMFFNVLVAVFYLLDFCVFIVFCLGYSQCCSMVLQPNLHMLWLSFCNFTVRTNKTLSSILLTEKCNGNWSGGDD